MMNDVYRIADMSGSVFDIGFKWNWWRVVAQSVGALRYRPEGCGFQFDS
jgi:hypothetical protein